MPTLATHHSTHVAHFISYVFVRKCVYLYMIESHCGGVCCAVQLQYEQVMQVYLVEFLTVIQNYTLLYCSCDTSIQSYSLH